MISYHLEPFSEHHIIDSNSTAHQDPRSIEAGEIAFKRYPQLISQDNLPFVRSSSGQRVVDSATNWTAGTLILIFVEFVVNIGQGSPLRVATCTIRHCPSFSPKKWAFKSLPAKRRANEFHSLTTRSMTPCVPTPAHPTPKPTHGMRSMLHPSLNV